MAGENGHVVAWTDGVNDAGRYTVPALGLNVDIRSGPAYSVDSG